MSFKEFAKIWFMVILPVVLYAFLGSVISVFLILNVGVLGVVVITLATMPYFYVAIRFLQYMSDRI